MWIIEAFIINVVNWNLSWIQIKHKFNLNDFELLNIFKTVQPPRPITALSWRIMKFIKLYFFTFLFSCCCWKMFNENTLKDSRPLESCKSDSGWFNRQNFNCDEHEIWTFTAFRNRRNSECCPKIIISLPTDCSDVLW